jgi:gliding motility-associated-like protein
MKYLRISLLFFVSQLSIKIGYSQCNTALITQTFTNAGYIPLNVQGQPCSMYFVNPASQDANISEQQAQALGAHLVVFNDAAENVAVNNALNASAFAGQTIWVGYKRTAVAAQTFYTLDGTSGNFVPNSGSGIYENWDSGEPNNNAFASGCFPTFSCSSCSDQYRCTNGEECVQIRSSGLWNDLPCDRSSVSVIEVNLCPVPSANSPTICIGANTNLNATTVLGSNPYTYTWDNGAGTGASVSVSPAVTTTYNLTVTDRYSCTGTASTTVTVDPGCTPPACDLAAVRNAFQQATGYVEISVPGQPCSMYFVNTRSQDALVSEQQANQLGAHMVVFNDAQENTDVAAALNGAGYSGSTIWIGYKRTGTAQQTFYTLDGTSGPFIPNNAPTVYQNWAGGEPNNNGYNNCFGGCGFFTCSDQYRCNNGEQCVQIYPGGQWNDLPCNRTSISVVEINLCPQITVPAVNTLCLGQQAQLNASTLLGSVPYSYTWSTGATTTSITVSPTQTTTYTVTVSDRYSCTADRSVTIPVDTGYLANFYSPLSVCQGGSATITYAGNAPTNANYIWNFDGGTVVSGSGQGPYTITWNTTGTKNVSLDITAAGNCPTVPVTQQVLVTPLPSPDAGPDVSFCSGGSAAIGASGQPGSIYSWSPTTGLSDSTSSNPTVTLTNITTNPVATVYTLTENANGCIGSSTVTVTVNPATVVNTNPNGAIQICQGGQATITADPGYASYVWSNNAAGQVLTVNSAGNYFVVATDANGCQSVSQPVNVTINPPLPLNVTVGGPTQLCQGESVSLIADPGLNNFLWSNNATGQTLVANATGNYNVSASDANGCEYVSSFTNVQVFPKPVINTLSVSNVSCFGLNDGRADFTSTGGTQPYQYFTLNGTPLNGSSISGLNPANHDIYVSDANQCGDTISFAITEPSAPLQINLISLKNVTCFGGSDGNIVLSTTGGTPDYVYNWSNSSGGANISSLLPGDYTVTVSDNNGCSLTDTFTVTQHAEIEVTLPESYEILLGQSVRLVPVYDSTNIFTFLWKPDNNLSNPRVPSPNASPYQTITYTLTISDTAQCEATATTIVNVKDSIVIYIPNIFSPNGDGINDVFYVYANAVKDFYMTIYNRWGEKVFEANDIRSGWNGNFNGKALEPDVYVYYIQFTYLNYTQEKRKGSITLIR